MSQPEGDHNNPNNAREPLPSPPEAAGAALAALPDLLLRPLGDDVEMRHIFRGDIEERLRHAEVRKGELSPEQAVKWLAAQPATAPGRSPWLLPLLIIAALLTPINVGWEFYGFLPSFISSPGAPQALREAGERQVYRIPAHREDNPLLDAGYDPAAAAEKSWHAHPGDPVLYYYYLRTSVNTLDNLPPDYEATWKRLDPDNAFWLLYQARLTLCSPSLALSKTTFKSPSSVVPPAVRNAVEMLLQDAARLPQCHSYDMPLRGFLDTQRHVPVTSAQASALGMDVALRIVGADSERAEWTKLWNMAQANRPVLAADTQTYEKLKIRLGEIRDELAAADEFSNGEERLRSLERAEGIVGFRMLAALSAAVFLLLAGVLILRQFPARGPAGRMALCLRQLLDPRRLLVLVPQYVAPPVLVVVILAFFVGQREVYKLAFLLWAATPSFMLLALVLMVESARREVSRRTAFLGLRSTALQRRFGWLMAVLAGVSTVVAFCANSVNFSMLGTFYIVAGGCYGAPLLWLGVKGLLGFASPTANVRHRLIAWRLVPVMLIAAVALNIVALCLRPVERALVRMAVRQSNANLP
jgi:hypothetical protein